MNAENILIFRIGHLGDTVIALPALWEIRRNFPSSKVTLLTNIDVRNPGYISPADVLPAEGLIDEFIAYPTNLGRIERSLAFSRLWRGLRREKFDLAIYLMPRIRSSRQIDRDINFFRSAGISRTIGTDYIREHALPMEIPRPTPTVDRESDFLLDLLEREGLNIDRAALSSDLLITEQERAKAAGFLENASVETTNSLIAVAPGSKWPSKIWAEDRFKSVIDRLIENSDLVPVAFGAEEDRAAGGRLIAAWGKGVNAAGELAVRESAALLSRCSLYVGNDTGTMHLAAVVGTPCVAIFAAIDWKNRWMPFGEKNVIFRKSVECEGCLTPNCPNNNLCLDLVSEDEVYRACSEILGRSDD